MEGAIAVAFRLTITALIIAGSIWWVSAQLESHEARAHRLKEAEGG